MRYGVKPVGWRMNRRWRKEARLSPSSISTLGKVVGAVMNVDGNTRVTVTS